MRIVGSAALLVAISQAVASQSCAQFSPGPILLSQVPAYFPRQKVNDVATLLDIEEIRQTLSLYATIIDGHDFPSLSKIFTTNAVANYPAPIGILNGTGAIQSTLAADGVQFARGTQHLFGSQIIRICDKERAVSVAYFRASQLLQQNATIGATELTDDSAMLYTYGQYQDSWVKLDGLWKIAYRNLLFMVSLQ